MAGGTGGPGNLPGGNKKRDHKRDRRKGGREREEKGSKNDDFEKKHPRASTGTSTGGQFVKAGSSGREAKTVQEKVGAKADGKYGGQTAKAVRAYQKKKGLEVDGVVGAQTAAAMRGEKAKVGALTGKDRSFLKGGGKKKREADAVLDGAVAVAEEVLEEWSVAARVAALKARRAKHGKRWGKNLGPKDAADKWRANERAAAGSKHTIFSRPNPKGSAGARVNLRRDKPPADKDFDAYRRYWGSSHRGRTIASARV
jgi:hypothetical protein